jgi:hypothetical protein
MDLKQLLLEKSINENDVLNGIDMILEVLADKEFIKNGITLKRERYVSIHKILFTIINELKSN